MHQVTLLSFPFFAVVCSPCSRRLFPDSWSALDTSFNQGGVGKPPPPLGACRLTRRSPLLGRRSHGGAPCWASDHMEEPPVGLATTWRSPLYRVSQPITGGRFHPPPRRHLAEAAARGGGDGPGEVRSPLSRLPSSFPTASGAPHAGVGMLSGRGGTHDGHTGLQGPQGPGCCPDWPLVAGGSRRRSTITAGDAVATVLSIDRCSDGPCPGLT